MSDVTDCYVVATQHLRRGRCSRDDQSVVWSDLGFYMFKFILSPTTIIVSTTNLLWLASLLHGNLDVFLSISFYLQHSKLFNNFS